MTEETSITGKPLTGRRVAITRAREQAGGLRQQLADLGAEVVELPLIQVSKAVDKETLFDVLSEFGSYDWIVFTSVNGVRFFFEEFRRAFDDIRAMGCIRIAVVGDATAKAVRDHWLHVELQPKKATADALAKALIDTGSLDSAKVLVVTGNLNRDTLVTRLEEASAIVDQLQVYQTEETNLGGDAGAGDFRQHGADAILFASPSAAQAFVDQAVALKLAKGARQPLAGSIGEITSAAMRQLGLPVDFEAEKSTMEGLVGALVRKLNGR
ncbi:MAG: uroporphyrinogen-III synthase [Opitutaceae bacterium]|nr:uroporphyrinogen-III synthase [Opitutaceae bacterium]